MRVPLLPGLRLTALAAVGCAATVVVPPDPTPVFYRNVAGLRANNGRSDNRIAAPHQIKESVP